MVQHQPEVEVRTNILDERLCRLCRVAWILPSRGCVNEAEAANDREVKASLSPRLYRSGNRSPHCEASGNFVVTERLLADNKTNAAIIPQRITSLHKMKWSYILSTRGSTWHELCLKERCLRFMAKERRLLAGMSNKRREENKTRCLKRTQQKDYWSC